MTWRLVYAKHALKDVGDLTAAGLKPKAQTLLGVLVKDPYGSPPPFEKLMGDLTGAYSRRINIHHRLVYQVIETEHTVKVLRMWTHYAD